MGQGPENIQVFFSQNLSPLLTSLGWGWGAGRVRLTVIRRKPKAQKKPDSSLCPTTLNQAHNRPVAPRPGQISNPATSYPSYHFPTTTQELATPATHLDQPARLELPFPQSIFNTLARVIFSRCNSNHISPLSRLCNVPGLPCHPQCSHVLMMPMARPPWLPCPDSWPLSSSYSSHRGHLLPCCSHSLMLLPQLDT